ncbi:S1 family peptidase [Streptomyces sp. NPDC020379]|uniref:S1 family peptidase n=1 Tax=Streptomyces sp. NPDC020379 TaxID=3365071 RepID=UPI0037BCD689
MNRPAKMGLLSAATLLTLPMLSAPTFTTPTLAASARAGACSSVQMEQLHSLQGELDKLAIGKQAGRAQYWYVDPDQCKISVAVLGGADDVATRQFVTTATTTPGLAAVTEIGQAVSSWVAKVPAPEAARSSHLAGTYYGGSAIYSGTSGTVYECTSGFNNYHPGTATTAGHCGAAASTWYDGHGAQLGTVSSYKFPGADWAVIQPTSGWTLSNYVEVNGGELNIYGFSQPQLNQPVCGTGATTGQQCGKVIATNVTVNYPDGAVTGLAESSQSGNGGDSGGPVYQGPTGPNGVGLISGGPAGGGSPTFFQPLNF